MLSHKKTHFCHKQNCSRTRVQHCVWVSAEQCYNTATTKYKYCCIFADLNSSGTCTFASCLLHTPWHPLPSSQLDLSKYHQKGNGLTCVVDDVSSTSRHTVVRHVAGMLHHNYIGRKKENGIFNTCVCSFEISYPILLWRCPPDKYSINLKEIAAAIYEMQTLILCLFAHLKNGICVCKQILWNLIYLKG